MQIQHFSVLFRLTLPAQCEAGKSSAEKHPATASTHSPFIQMISWSRERAGTRRKSVISRSRSRDSRIRMQHLRVHSKRLESIKPIRTQTHPTKWITIFLQTELRGIEKKHGVLKKSIREAPNKLDLQTASAVMKWARYICAPRPEWWVDTNFDRATPSSALFSGTLHDDSACK